MGQGRDQLPQPLHWRLERASKRLTRRGLYSFLDRQMAMCRPGDRILSIGGGGPIDELVRAHARERGSSVTSVDVDPGRGPDLVADICEARASIGGPYDVVVLAEVLEHLHDPVRGLANLRNALVEGGLLVVTVPFMLGLHNRPRDFFRPTRYGLELLLGEFTSVEITERTGWAETILLLIARHHREQGRRARALAVPLLLLAMVLMPLARRIDRFAPSDTITGGYLVTARR